jgi:LemA protein
LIGYEESEKENTMNTIVSLAFLFAILGVIAYVVTIFNGLIALKNDIAKAWANIDILLKQRHDELSKLLDVCKGYMDYERDTLQKITQARSMYQQAVSVDQKAQADQSMTSALRGFFAVAENYPQLKANDNFTRLQSRITELESQIADRREFYNDSVNTFNIRIQQMPDTFVASFMNLTPRTMFKVEEGDKADVPMTFSATK